MAADFVLTFADSQVSIPGLRQRVHHLGVTYTLWACGVRVLAGVTESATQSIALNRRRTTAQGGAGISHISMGLEDSSVRFAFGLVVFTCSREL